MNNNYDIEEIENTISYYKKGTRILHRIDGPAFEHYDGDQLYFINGNPHRTDGPAYISPINSTLEYWVNGKRHRIDGPAIIEGNKEEYWIYGKEATPEETALIKMIYEKPHPLNSAQGKP